MLIALFVVAMATSLVAGTAWAMYGRLPDRVDGFIVALSGGALLIAVVLELIQPIIRNQAPWLPMAAILAGGVLYTALNEALSHLRSTDQAATTSASLLLSGIPENLAVGITLIDQPGLSITALAGSIFLANVPEAAGATKVLCQRGYTRRAIWLLWSTIIVLLGAAAVVGFLAFSSTDPFVLGYLRCFTAGAIVASLALDVFPRAFQTNHRLAGIATVLGLLLALALNQIR
ncbi:zinc/iron permease [Salinisphaera sp. S4-8]|uniref:ZIP family metal transporter n=1 Tax=Salinisphaera sp. S4-8 TaxID=633357 RepID=UPI00334027BB